MNSLTLTAAQLAVLGLAVVAGSFALNGLLVRAIVTAVVKSTNDRLKHIEDTLAGADGVLVRLGQIETILDERARLLAPRDVGRYQQHGTT